MVGTTSSHTPRLIEAAVALACLFALAPLFSIAAANILLAAVAAALLYARVRWQMPPVSLPLALFLVGTLLSAILNGHFPDAWPQLRKFYVFASLPVAFTAFRRHLSQTRLAAGWVLAASVAAAWSIVQFLLKMAAAKQAGRPFYEYYVVERTTGFMSHWMTFGGTQMIVFLLACSWFIWPGSAARRRWLIAAGASLMAVALLLNMTRGIWIACSVGLLYLIWHWNKRWLAAAPVLAVLVIAFSPPPVRERMVSLVRPHGELDSNRHRVVTWRTGLEMIRARPWFGLGPERVGAEFETYVPQDVERPLPPGWYGHLHNIYLHYAAERGIPVLLALLWFLGKILRDTHAAAGRAAKSRNTRNLGLLRGAAAVVIAILVEGIFEYNLGDSEVLFLFLTVAASAYAAAAQVAGSVSPEESAA